MLKLTKKFRNKKGFSLTELIVVIAILGILAAIATPNVIKYIDDSKVGADAANAKILENTCKRLMADQTLDFVNLADAPLKAAVAAEAGPIPACKVTGKSFQLDKDTGVVTVVTTAGWAAVGNEMLLN